MFFGLTTPSGAQFDPVHHFDFDKCTITVDTGLTNFAMGGFVVDQWDKIREKLKMIPLHSPLWRPDPSLGMALWRGRFDLSVTPRAPVPSFDIPLLPSSTWLSHSLAHQLRCSGCEKNFDSVGHWIHHCRERHSSQTLVDSEPKTLGPEQQRVDETHWKTLTCPEPNCGQMFHGRGYLVRHIQYAHSGERPYQCTECGQAFKLPSALKRHTTESHTDARPYRCSVCGASFKRTESLKEHSTSHSTDRPYRCAHQGCQKAFKTAHEFEKHLRRHSAQRTHECTYPNCTQAFKTASELRQHLPSHSEDRPHVCTYPDCLKAFKTAADLKLHVACHSDAERKHKCTHAECPKVFRRASDLRGHMRVHSDERPHRCTYTGCSKSFKTAKALRQHLVTHSDEKGYVCSHCGEGFKRPQGLSGHIARCHSKGA